MGGWTALHLAADGGHDRVVEMLLKAEADVDKQDRGGRTALHLAAKRGHDRVVAVLKGEGRIGSIKKENSFFKLLEDDMEMI